MNVIFQPVTESDLKKLQEVALSTFIDSYRHLNSEENFNWYVNRAFQSEKLLSEIQNLESFFFFATLNSNIIGYLKLNIGDSQTESFGSDFIEVERIYLISEFQRKGIGSIMLDFAIIQARRLFKTIIWLGVWDQNPQAISFYKKMGFIESGSHIFKFGDEDQIDIIMQKTII